MNASFGDLPSWITVLLIGLGIIYATSQGMLSPSALPIPDLGELLVLAALGLGAFYFLMDISRKV